MSTNTKLQKCQFSCHKPKTKKKSESTSAFEPIIPFLTPVEYFVALSFREAHGKLIHFFFFYYFTTLKRKCSLATVPYDCGKQFSGIHIKSVKSKHDEELGNAQRKYNFSNQYA